MKSTIKKTNADAEKSNVPALREFDMTKVDKIMREHDWDIVMRSMNLLKTMAKVIELDHDAELLKDLPLDMPIRITRCTEGVTVDAPELDSKVVSLLWELLKATKERGCTSVG